LANVEQDAVYQYFKICRLKFVTHHERYKETKQPATTHS
jgi:hypothetical protein